MKKKPKQLLAIFLSAVLILSVPGCKGKVLHDPSNNSDTLSMESATSGNSTLQSDNSGNSVSGTGNPQSDVVSTPGSTNASTQSGGDSSASKDNLSSSVSNPNGQAQTTNPITSGNGKVVIWGSNQDLSLVLAVGKYKTKYPSINIKLTPSSMTSLNSLKMAVMAGNGPDVISMDHVYATSLGTEGIFADLTPYGATKVKDLFTQSCYDANCVGNKVYALPWSANVVNLMYSKDLFNQAGLSSPPTNYTEFLDDCKKLKNKGYQAFSFPYGGPGSNKNWSAFMFFTWLWREGGEILATDSNGKSVAAFDGPAGVEALTKLVDLYKQGYMGVRYTEDMGSGGTAMMQMGTWKIDLVSGINVDNNGVAVVPKLVDNVAPYSGLGLFSYCVSAKAQDPQAAYNFIELLCTDEDLQIKYNKKVFITPLISAQSNSSYTTGKDAEAWKVFFEQLKYSKFRPGIPGWEDIEKSVSDGVYAAVTGKSDAQAALTAAANVVNSNLKRIYG